MKHCFKPTWQQCETIKLHPLNLTWCVRARARVCVCVSVCVCERERERASLHPTKKENNSNNKHEIRNSFNTTIGSNTE